MVSVNQVKVSKNYIPLSKLNKVNYDTIELNFPKDYRNYFDIEGAKVNILDKKTNELLGTGIITLGKKTTIKFDRNNNGILIQVITNKKIAENKQGSYLDISKYLKKSK